MAFECSKKKIVFTVIDITIVGGVALAALLVHTLSSPYKRGFYCDDESIKYPFHDSTIPSSVLYSVGFIFNFIAFFTVEGILLHIRRQNFLKNGGSTSDSTSDHQLVNNTLSSSSSASNSQAQQPSFLLEYMHAVYSMVLPFLFGSAMEFLIRDIAKFSIGRLRPHFIAVCRPDFSQIKCSDGYIENYVCLDDNTHRLTEARLSFPSGHSSFSVYSMLYLILYVQARIRWRSAVLLRPCAQLIFFVMAFYTCISRVFDYKHHWSDVLTGAILGLVICLIVVFKVSTLYKKDHRLHKYLYRRPTGEGDQRVALDTVAKCIPV